MKAPVLSIGALLRFVFAWMVFSIIFISSAQADTPVTLTETFAGNMDFALTGGSFRAGPDADGLECDAIQGASTSTLTVPNGANIEAAFLYWSGNGETADTTVSLNGVPVTADRVYTSVTSEQAYVYYGNTLYYYQGNGVDYDFTYFSGKADVTNLISSGTSSISVSNLSFTSGKEGNPYCPTATVYGGWALVVVYEQASEPLRVVNIFDGFQMFQGTSITLRPDNFIIDSDPGQKEGHHAHITWEGDAGNSQSNNNSTEDLYFNGNELTDGNNPAQNQFNSYSNQVGSTNGVDIDSYQVGQYLTEGDTSATTIYSSGQDRVFLSAEILSVPNKTVADLQLTSSGTVGVVRGNTATYTLTTTNNGPSNAPSGTVITIPLTDGLTLDSFSGNSWNCSATTSLITCTLNRSISDESTAPALTLSLGTAATTQTSLNLTATVNGVEFDNRSSNNTATLAMTIGAPDLSGSTKELDTTDIGSSISAGDTLTYVITLNNSGSADAEVTVTDHLPAEFASFQVTAIPSGASVASFPAPAGNNGAGYFVVSGADVAATGSATITVQATLNESVVEGTSITNTATISDGINADVNVSSSPVVIGQALSTTGNKPLYLQMDNSLTRVASTDTTSNFTINSGGYEVFQLAALQTDLRIDTSQAIAVQLWLNSPGGRGGGGNRTHEVGVGLYIDGVAGSGTAIAEWFGGVSVSRNGYNLNTISMPISNGAPTIVPAGSVLNFVVYQQQNDNRTMNLRVAQGSGWQNASYVALNSYTIINIDQLGAYTDAYPSGSKLTEVMETSTIYFRAVVSDPFGYEDISETRWTVTDNNGNNIVNDQVINPVSSSGTLNVYQLGPFNVADETAIGQWTISMISEEGDEGMVTAKRKAVIEVVGRPEPVVIKTVEAQWDPVNLFDNPKAIPGSYLVYTLTVRNEGDGEIEADTIAVVDPIENLVPLFVQGNLDQSSSAPFVFTDGAVSSGLSFSFNTLDDNSDDIDFSTDGNDFTYDPSADVDAEGFNANVSHIRFTPKGTMNAANGTQYPEFTLKFKVKVE